jgi:hypothetical protein
VIGAGMERQQVAKAIGCTTESLRLRALRASGDVDDYWRFNLAKEHERTHASRYADGAVSTPLPPSRPHLRLVQ